jgi:hypothetical protein
MIEELWRETALTPNEREHLSLCAECQQQFASLAQVRDEFDVARMSQVRPEAEARLFSIFEQVHGDAPQANPLQKLAGAVVGWVNALPLWDSRQSMGAVGIRNGNQSSYRLLFGAHETEIELMVEPQNGLLRVMGEVMIGSEEKNCLALIELASSTNAKSALEAESDVHGRFSLERVLPGTYRMTVTPRYSPMVVVEPLELT